MVERLKRSAAARVEVQPSPAADQRSEMLLRRYDTDLDVVIDNEFGGVEGEHRQQIGDLRTQVTANWQAANRHFVQIGMLILDAEHALPNAANASTSVATSAADRTPTSTAANPARNDSISATRPGTAHLPSPQRAPRL